MFDALVVAGWYRDSADVAAEMALIGIEVFAVTGALQSVFNVAFSRERPFGERCGNGKPADGRDCDSPRRFFSFFSGHTSQAFASAALTCTHHARFPLYGEGNVGSAICGAGLALAAATGILRISGDQHYLSDVVVGAAMGSLVGFGLPYLLHYGGAKARFARDSAGFELRLLPMPNGAAAVGRF